MARRRRTDASEAFDVPALDFIAFRYWPRAVPLAPSRLGNPLPLVEAQRRRDEMFTRWRDAGFNLPGKVDPESPNDWLVACRVELARCLGDGAI